MASYVPSITEDEARKIIREADRAAAIDAAKRFANVTEADIDADGDVWVANPCTVHRALAQGRQALLAGRRHRGWRLTPQST